MDDCTYKAIDLAIKGIALLGTAIGAFVAAYTYKRNRQLERAKWLNGLFEKFFEKETYKRIRVALDYQTKDYEDLKELLDRDSNANSDLQEALIVYLNFFEYVATLWKNKQIETGEVEMLFGYYYRLLNKSEHSWLMAYAKKHDFDYLQEIAKALKQDEK